MLALVALSLAWLLYQLQRAGERRRDLDSARAVLTAAERGLVGARKTGDLGTAESATRGWGDWFFGTVWMGDALEARAEEDFEYVMKRSYGEIFEVPTAPLDALIRSPDAGNLILPETIQAANYALFRIGVFNQLVRQKSQFNAQHLAEFVDDALAGERRMVLAKAARMQSHMLHGSGIGAANAESGWYRNLTTAMHNNTSRLDEMASRRWWFTGSVLSGVALVTATVVLAVSKAA